MKSRYIFVCGLGVGAASMLLGARTIGKPSRPRALVRLMRAGRRAETYQRTMTVRAPIERVFAYFEAALQPHSVTRRAAPRLLAWHDGGRTGLLHLESEGARRTRVHVRLFAAPRRLAALSCGGQRLGLDAELARARAELEAEPEAWH